MCSDIPQAGLSPAKIEEERFSEHGSGLLLLHDIYEKARYSRYGVDLDEEGRCTTKHDKISCRTLYFVFGIDWPSYHHSDKRAYIRQDAAQDNSCASSAAFRDCMLFA